MPLGCAPGTCAGYQGLLTFFQRLRKPAPRPFLRLFFPKLYTDDGMWESVSAFWGFFCVAFVKSSQQKNFHTLQPFGNFMWHMWKTSRERGLAYSGAALEEWLEALSILQNNQGRSTAAPLAASRQRTRWRDRTQPQRYSRMLRAS